MNETVVAVNGFVEALGMFFRKILLDVDINEINQKIELVLKNDHQDMLVVFNSLLVKLQVLTCLEKGQNQEKMEADDSNSSEHVTEDTLEQPSSTKMVDESLVQIRADKAEVERRIAAFIERKQKEVDDTNVREFCGRLHPNNEGHSCARTDAVFMPRSDSKSHVKVTKVENLYGPQTRLLSTNTGVDVKAGGIKKEPDQSVTSGIVGLEQRLNTMEEHVQSGAGSRDVFKRIKALEERILYLESLSPEYFTVCNNKGSRSRNEKLHSKRQYKQQSQAWETSSIDNKIQQLKAKILAKKVKQEPG